MTRVARDGIPPAFGHAFLEWFREATEVAWAGTVEWTLADYERAGVGGTGWRRGTRWTGGLSEEQIDGLERELGIRFPPPHRLFLQVLHATEPRRRGAGFVDGVRMSEVDVPGFCNWLTDGDVLGESFAWIVEGLVFDVEANALWLDGWGPRPSTAEERHARVEELVRGAPNVIPILGHRFLLDAEPYPVLSIYGSDILVYGADLRSFLLHEMCSVLGLERDPAWMNADVSAVPFWGELIGR